MIGSYWTYLFIEVLWKLIDFPCPCVASLFNQSGFMVGGGVISCNKKGKGLVGKCGFNQSLPLAIRNRFQTSDLLSYCRHGQIKPDTSPWTVITYLIHLFFHSFKKKGTDTVRTRSKGSQWKLRRLRKHSILWATVLIPALAPTLFCFYWIHLCQGH